MENKNIKTNLFIIGLILILVSPLFGYTLGEIAIKLIGGTMDTSTYEWIIESTTANIRIIGSILSVIGGFSSLFYQYFLNNKND
ncbi:hypothetical protein [Faecalimicrobium sp. JNUCC 81]